MSGIVPAAGIGSRIQPLAFSKELLPVGSRFDSDAERPRAVSEYLVERMLIAAGADSKWIWGAFKMPGATLQALRDLWCERGRSDVYMGTLVNAWIARSGRPRAVRAGTAYVDVGTLHGYRGAITLLKESSDERARRRSASGR